MMTSDANADGSACSESATSASSTAAGRLRAIRKAAGLSQHELAARLGVHRLTVSRLERGESSLSIDQAVRIAEALGIDPARFLAGGRARVLRVRAVSRPPVTVTPAGPADRALWAEIGGAAGPMALDSLIWFTGRAGVALFVEPVDPL